MVAPSSSLQFVDLTRIAIRFQMVPGIQLCSAMRIGFYPREPLMRQHAIVVLLALAFAVGTVQPAGAWPDLTTKLVEMSPAVHPAARYWTAMAHDSESERVILFGGETLYGYFGDTWAYDIKGNAWTNMEPSTSPEAPYSGPGLAEHCMAYDSKADRVILFGGVFQNMNQDTWAYDFNANTWQDMGPVPSGLYPRIECAMTYDSKVDRIIEFGGYAGGTTFNQDTWAYDYGNNTWTKMAPSVSPPGRFGHSMAYDSKADRILLYGGSAPWPIGDFWAYDYGGDNWTALRSLTDQNAEGDHALVYKASSDLAVLIAAGVWAYDYDNNNWTSLDIGRINWDNYGADYQSAAYVVGSDRAVTFGGLLRVTGTSFSNHTWSLQVGPDTGSGPFTGSAVLVWGTVAVGAAAVVSVLLILIRRRRRKASPPPPKVVE